MQPHYVKGSSSTFREDILRWARVIVQKSIFAILHLPSISKVFIFAVVIRKLLSCLILVLQNNIQEEDYLAFLYKLIMVDELKWKTSNRRKSTFLYRLMLYNIVRSNICFLISRFQKMYPPYQLCMFNFCYPNETLRD